MNLMRKYICLLLVFCTLATLAVPAMAVAANEENGLLPGATQEIIPLSVHTERYAGTYSTNSPFVTLNTTGSNITIPYDETVLLEFTIQCPTTKKRLLINFYDSNGTLVCPLATPDFGADPYIEIVVAISPAEYGLVPDNYTIEYYLEYYNNGWAPSSRNSTELAVLENKCNGNHNYVMDSTYLEPTCTEEGIGQFKCSTCGHILYDSLPVTDHAYGEGQVTTAPTDLTPGERTFICSGCGKTITESIPALGVTPEKPYKIANVVSGVHVYWQATEGAVKYGLWRSETGKNGTYKWVANPTVPHFTDTKVESGKTYYYKVTSMVADGIHSEKSDAIGITYVATPDITSRFNKAAGITLGWEKVQGATGYAIYRKSYSGNDAWVRVGTIEGNSTFTWQDTSVKNDNGTAYKYTIRALAGSDMKTLSGCRNAGRSMVRLTSRTLSSAAKADATSIKCSWTTSSAVTGYEVRFMVGNEVYKTFTVGNYKTGTKTFTGLKAGQTYKIQVRSYVKIDGMGFYSAWSEAKNVTLP